MDHTYWHKQPANQPLFSDTLWSQPENKLHAGKLLIIGGNEHIFAAPAEAYAAAINAGVGVAKVLLPDKLQKTIGSLVENGEFAPSNKSGSFAKQALAEWLDFASWADGVLLAGDMGRNSETSVVVEQFLQKYPGQVTITKDTVEALSTTVKEVFSRQNTTLVITIAQLQKLAKDMNWPQAVRFNMGNINLVELLHALTKRYPCCVVVMHNDVIFVASQGEVSTTPMKPSENWRVRTASGLATWWLQNPSNTFEAMTCAVYQAEKQD